MRPEQGTLISRAQAIAALLELLTDQPVIICNGFPRAKRTRSRIDPRISI